MESGKEKEGETMKLSGNNRTVYNYIIGTRGTASMQDIIDDIGVAEDKVWSIVTLLVNAGYIRTSSFGEKITYEVA